MELVDASLYAMKETLTKLDNKTQVKMITLFK